MLVQTPIREAGPLVYGDYGEGEGWYQEIVELDFDPISGLGSPFSFKKVFKKVARAVGKVATVVLPPVTIAAATGILGKTLKQTAKKTLHVVGGAMRIAAPFASVIPGVGPIAAGALAAGGTVIGRMLQRDKPLQVFTQPKTYLQAGGAALATQAIGAIKAGSIGGWLGGEAPVAGQTLAEAEAAAMAARDAQMSAYGGGWFSGNIGDTLGQVGRTAVTGLNIYERVAPYFGGKGVREAVPVEPVYLPGAADPYFGQPEFPGFESRVEGGVPADSGAMMFPEMEGEVSTAAAGLPMPLMLGAGALLLLFASRR